MAINLSDLRNAIIFQPYYGTIDPLAVDENGHFIYSDSDGFGNFTYSLQKFWEALEIPAPVNPNGVMYTWFTMGSDGKNYNKLYFYFNGWYPLFDFESHPEYKKMKHTIALLGDKETAINDEWPIIPDDVVVPDNLWKAVIKSLAATNNWSKIVRTLRDDTIPSLEEEITSVSATIEALSTTMISDYATKEELANIDISGTGDGSYGGYAPLTYNLILTPTDWIDNNQSVTATGVTHNNVVFVSPAPMDAEVYIQAGIFCSTQERNSLGFSCETIPTTAITINVVVFAKNSGSGEGNIEYELPIATSETLGGVKIGDGLEIDEDGTISIDVDSLPTPELSLPVASTDTFGVVKIGESLSINDGVIDVDTNNLPELPVASTTALGVVQIGDGLSVNDGIVSLSNNFFNMVIKPITIDPDDENWGQTGNATIGSNYHIKQLNIQEIQETSYIFIIPNAKDVSVYNNSQITYREQQQGSITLYCTTKPTNKITIGVIIYN